MIGMKKAHDIRWYELADLPEMVRLHQESFPSERWTAQKFCNFASKAGNGCIVSVRDGRIAACMLYHQITRSRIRIEYLSVDKYYRRRGVGTELLWTLLSGHKGRTFTAMAQEDNTEAHLFLKSFGFEAVPPFVCENFFADKTGAIPFQLRTQRPRKGRTNRLLVGSR